MKSTGVTLLVSLLYTNIGWTIKKCSIKEKEKCTKKNEDDLAESLKPSIGETTSWCFIL